MRIETNDCILRTIAKNDAKAFYHLIQNNKSRLEDYFAGTVAKTTTLDNTVSYCTLIESLIAKREYFPFLIESKLTNEVIGLIDFKNIDWNVPKAEVGAFIDVKSEGNGLIIKSGKVLIDQIVKQFQFKKIFCRAASENKRSIKTILTFGFELEGTLRRDYKTTNGRLVNLNYYGKLYD